MPARTLLPAIFFLAAQLASGETTYYKDVLPVLQKHCQQCHRPGDIAPMPLLTFNQTRPWAKAIKTAVLTKKMPPWFADPLHGKFSNDLSLSAAEIAVLGSWADGGAKAGTPSDAPTPLKFSEGWRIPNPDVVFELPQPVNVPPTGVVDYKFFNVPTGFTEDRWVEMIEVRPTERSVVHHAIVYANGSYLGGYAPGAVPQIWKPGEARLVRAGSVLNFQMHYTTTGKAATDRTQIGLVFAKRPPEMQILAMQSLNHMLEIPPNTSDYIVESSRALPLPALLVGMRAHMHLRGKAFQFRAVYPDGRTEILLDIPKYDFNWQPYYYLQTPLKLPQGTRIECTAHFDNSVNNPFNPDPNSVVRWGEQSWEEMMIGWFDIALPTGY